MDESHLMACARYVEQNPVGAKLVKRAQDWIWSSASARLAGRDDGLVRVELIPQADHRSGRSY